MDDVLRVRFFERLGDLCPQGDDLFFGQRTHRDFRGQRLSRHILHGDKIHALFSVKVVYQRDVRVIELGESQGLAAETSARRFVGKRAGRQHLERHFAT